MSSTVSRQSFGFTIVELLVVIVVIGALAAITLVSYTGINQRAIVASLQSELSSAARVLKMYYTDNGQYPQDMTLSGGKYCPTTPADARYCIQVSSGNILSYNSPSPYSTFSVTADYGNVAYRITNNSAASIVVAASGGTVTNANGIRTHTFTSNGTFSVTTGGPIDVSIKGAGGGAGGPLWEDECQFTGDPSAGGPSIVSKSGIDWRANGGGAGSTITSYCLGSGTGVDGAPGTTNSPSGWVSTNGGGAAGGSKYAWGSGLDWEQYGSNGGAGGKLEKTDLTVNSGDSYTVTVGTTDANSGSAGRVTFSYPR